LDSASKKLAAANSKLGTLTTTLGAVGTAGSARDQQALALADLNAVTAFRTDFNAAVAAQTANLTSAISTLAGLSTTGDSAGLSNALASMKNALVQKANTDPKGITEQFVQTLVNNYFAPDGSGMNSVGDTIVNAGNTLVYTAGTWGTVAAVTGTIASVVGSGGTAATVTVASAA